MGGRIKIQTSLLFSLLQTLPLPLATPSSSYPLLPHGHSQCDMADKREVSNGEGEILARNLKCPFFETSAKLRVHIDECFHELVREIKKVQLEKNRELTDKKKKGGNCVIL